MISEFIFFDWLSIYQDFDFKLPVLSETVNQEMCTITGEILRTSQPIKKHEGSHSTSIQIKISNNRITVEGNPSRLNRLDNLFGLTTLDQCVAVYNKVLLSLGLPPFTKCTKVLFHQGEDGKKVQKSSNGAIITETHVTSNFAVGRGFEKPYLKGVATQPYRNMIPNLFANGNTVEWKTKNGKASMVYPIFYGKALDMEERLLPKIKRLHGKDSEEYNYLQKLIGYCKEQGVVRAEQKFKSAYLRRHNLRFWGLFDESHFIDAHKKFRKLDEKLQVAAMEIETVAERLLSEGVVDSLLAARSTASYAFEWAHGKSFDLTKTQPRTHRTRLRKIGIDIKYPFDANKHCLITVKKSTEIVVQPLEIPSWYRRADTKPNLQLVA